LTQLQLVVPSQRSHEPAFAQVPVQQVCVGEHDWPMSAQLGGGVQEQPVSVVHGTPAFRQVVFSPGQHGLVGEQDGSGCPWT
jgi:hypothetical protein